MATRGDFGYDDPKLDDDIDHDDDDDDDQEVNTTQPFQPGAASTPYHDGEQHEMQTMMHEQEGLPDTSYEETSLLGAQQQMRDSWNSLTRLFPRASATNLETSYSKTGRLQVKMAGFGKKSYPLLTREIDTGKERLNPKLPKEIKSSLGNSAQQILEEDQNSLQVEHQRFKEVEKQERVAQEGAVERAQAIAVKRGQIAEEMQNLAQKIERTQARIDANQSTNLESEAELNRLKQLKKNYESDLERKEKELADLEKQSKEKSKIRAKEKKKYKQK